MTMITIESTKRTGSKLTGKYFISYSMNASTPKFSEQHALVCSLSKEQSDELGRLICSGNKDIAGDWLEDNGYDRDLVNHLHAAPLTESVYETSAISYKVGDVAVYAIDRKYGSGYKDTGKITTITAKTVTITNSIGKAKRLSREQFIELNK